MTGVTTLTISRNDGGQLAFGVDYVNFSVWSNTPPSNIGLDSTSINESATTAGAVVLAAHRHQAGLVLEEVVA